MSGGDKASPVEGTVRYDVVKVLNEFQREIEELCKRDYQTYSHRVVTKTYRLMPNAN